MRISEMFQNNDWIGIWPSVSVILFFVIFVIIVYKVVRYDKTLVKKWEELPFESHENQSNGTDSSHS